MVHQQNCMVYGLIQNLVRNKIFTTTLNKLKKIEGMINNHDPLFIFQFATT